jgi:methionine-S-sulfoxide reductase
MTTAVFASGCFWGTEYWFQKMVGVSKTEVGYAGGLTENPSYREVCSGDTGHAECVRVTYDPETVSYEDLVKLFFETHDPSQVDHQGPDMGSQYRSAIFYSTPEEQHIAQHYVHALEQIGYHVATHIVPLSHFYPEKDPAHQQYYQKNGELPYCHIYQKRFS